MIHAAVLRAAGEATSTTDLGNVVAFLSGLAALVSVAITSLRKRQDVSVEEMQQRIKDLEQEKDELVTDLAAAKKSAIRNSRDLFAVREVLAARGIPDPTMTDEVGQP